jgi:spore coat protein U-like protein
MPRLVTPALLVVLGLLAGSAGQEAQAAAANRCTLNVTPLRFGLYNPISPVDGSSTGTIDYNCTGSTPITILLSAGSGSFAARQMRQGANALAYNLFLDAGGTQIWGDGTGGSQFFSDPAPRANTPNAVTIFGRIPARQTRAHIGAYSDRIVVTIIF